MADRSDALTEAVQSARAAGQRVSILGSGSKGFLTSTDADTGSRILSTSEHEGIEDYRPDELVVTVRTGTALRTLRQSLAREGQMLAFEPPEYRGLGTVGGAVAAGLAGPGRPWRGAVRDAVLGITLINGLGERLTFGGQVMKNVAGFDVSRLQAGAFGIFGVLLRVSLRVIPLPQAERTCVLELDRAAGHAWMVRMAALPLPITAACWLDGRLHVRLSGAEAAVQRAAGHIGGDTSADTGFWAALRDQSLPFFREGDLACRYVAPATPLAKADALIDWNGAWRWARAEGPDGFRPFGSGFARHRCRDAGGNAVLAKYQQRLKLAFDPDNLFNAELTNADVAA
ncbi:MAG: glycolate oxidase subunit GlcE [Pseudomonadales bacterium]